MSFATHEIQASVETRDGIAGDLHVAFDWQLVDRQAAATVVTGGDLGEFRVGGQVGIRVEREVRSLVALLLLEQLAVPRAQLERAVRERTVFPGVAIVAVRTGEFMLVPWRFDDVAARHPELLARVRITREPPRGAQMLSLDDLDSLIQPKG